MFAALAALALAAGALDGARALTLESQVGYEDSDENTAAELTACLAATGLPDCTAEGRPPHQQCIDAALLGEDMNDLGILPAAGSCAAVKLLGAGRGETTTTTAAPRAGKGRALADANPLAVPPEPGEVPPVNMSHEKPVMWIHIHKSMGTFIVFLAYLNGENIVRPSYNGNWWPHDTPSGASRKVSCENRTRFFQETNATWGQIEHQLEDEDLCHSTFNYGTFLRDPNEIAISKASYESYTAEQTIASLDCLTNTPAGENVTKACDHAAPKKHSWRLWWFWDNFLVRTLGGREVWSLPAGEVTEAHARKVIERLSKFDAVLFMEDFSDIENLKQKIGWHPKHYKKAKRNKNPSKHVVDLTEEQAAQARHTNRFDYMVIDHFKSLSAQQRIRKLQ